MKWLPLFIITLLLLAPRQADADCTSPAKTAGEIIFNTDNSVLQYCNGADWVAIGKPVAPEPCDPVSSPSPGQVCDDGSYYIGQVGGNDIYATASASQSTQTWDNGTSSWTDTPADSTTDGPGNTAGLVALSDAGAPYAAAEYCDGLTNVHGHSDWYLPAKSELNLFYNGGSPVAGVNTSGSWYWSSTESGSVSAWFHRFSDGGQGADARGNSYLVRCVRRGDVASGGSGCTNPTADPGKIIYNTDHHLMQYCNGAVWVAMGPEGGGTVSVIEAVDFDGTNDYLSGNVTDSGTAFTLSFWIRPHILGADVDQTIFTNNTGRLLVRLLGNGDTDNLYSIEAHLQDSGGATLSGRITNEVLAAGVWSHVVMSGRAGFLFRIYINDVFGGGSTTAAGGTASIFSQPFFVGAAAGGTQKLNADIAEFWADDTYPNLSTEAERRKFLTADLKAANLGANGEIPLGATPMIYLKGPHTTFHTNLGHGGGFTPTGALTAALPVPPHEDDILPGPCTAPVRDEGTMIFNVDQCGMQYCDGADWVRLGNVSSDPCACNPSPGDVCSDGSVYAGLTPDGNLKMFTTPADAGTFPWNNGNSTGRTATGQTGNVTGQANTANLIGIDSDSGVGGVQPHQAAQNCADLTNVHGHSDWYLPAFDELGVLYTNRAAIGGFDTSGASYWSSTESSTNNGVAKNFNTGGWVGTVKDNTFLIRCVRR